MNIIPKSVIVYLYHDNPIHTKRFFDSIRLLHKNFLDIWSYPIVIFYESDNIYDIQQHIKQTYPNTKVYYHKLQFELDYSQEIIEKIPERFKGHWDEGAFFSMGYRHMCRFFAGKIFELPLLENVKYLLRIDCDSYFYDKMPYDIFAKMQENNYLYASVGEEEDMDYVIEGLYDTVKQYANKSLDHIKYNGMFKTHFDLTDFQWFKKNYMDYFNYLDKTGNIFIKRWGDAPIRYMGAKLLISDKQIHMFNDIPYKHGGDWHEV